MPPIPTGRALKPKPRPLAVRPLVNVPAMSSTREYGDPPQGYERWDESANNLLLEWFERPGHYAEYRNAGVKSSNGSTGTGGLRKVRVCQMISDFLASNKVTKSPTQIQNKIKALGISYQKATNFLWSTGLGLTTIEAKMGITEIRDKVLLVCPHWERLHPIMSERASSRPTFVGDSLDDVHEEAYLSNGKPVSQDNDKEHPSPEPIPSQVFPTPMPPPSPFPAPAPAPSPSPEGIAREQVVFPEESNINRRSNTEGVAGAQRPNDASEIDRRRGKQKVRGFTEALLSLGEQNRKLGEKKLTLRADWQQKQFELLTKKLDLQHEENIVRMKELEVQKLKIELELEKFRSWRKRQRESTSIDSGDEDDEGRGEKPVMMS